MKYFFIMPLVLVFLSGCAQSKTKDITEVSQNELNSGLVIDVRTPEEFAQGHLDNALNINWYDKDFASRIAELDKGETLYVYCKKGGRSANAQQFLDSLGYKKVVNLAGGYDAYTQK